MYTYMHAYMWMHICTYMLGICVYQAMCIQLVCLAIDYAALYDRVHLNCVNACMHVRVELY